MLDTWRDFLTLCKPRVVLLMLLTVWAGMYLAADHSISWQLVLTASLGIAFVSGASAAINHIIDHKIDALMERTKDRPLAGRRLTLNQAAIFSGILGSSGFAMLYYLVNPLTAVLTLLSALGYSLFYSIYLKRATSQNIVIGGLAGAMPPLLGWTAASNELAPQGWLLVLIIFTWTPAHFWALCLHRYKEYQAIGIPMLPITHGIFFTKLNIVFYSLLTLASSLLPFAIGMSGIFYLICAVLLGGGYVFYALCLQFNWGDERLALKTFHFSLIYLTLLFCALLLDHYLLVT